MSITIAQFNLLAETYKFDVSDARILLGLPLVSKRGRPAKTSPERVCEDVKCEDVKCVVVKGKKPKEPKKETDKPKRALSGYNLYMMDNRGKIAEKLKNDAGTDKLAYRGALFTAVGASWKSLTAREKAVWNNKAKAA